MHAGCKSQRVNRAANQKPQRLLLSYNDIHGAVNYHWRSIPQALVNVQLQRLIVSLRLGPILAINNNYIVFKQCMNIRCKRVSVVAAVISNLCCSVKVNVM